jgi:hypothetical protein
MPIALGGGGLLAEKREMFGHPTRLSNSVNVASPPDWFKEE